MQQSQYSYWIISLNIFILLVIPQLNTQHYSPLPEFFAEITFVWASISLFLIVCFINKKLAIPIIVLPLLIFGIWVAVQPYFVNINFIGLSYITSFEMLICIIIAITFNTLVKNFGLETVLITICITLTIGSILQSIIGFLQYSGLYKNFSWVFYDSAHPTTNIFGHFGQRNHYCHYLSWGIFSLVYLIHKDKIKFTVFLPILIWLIFSITIAASRSVLMYFACASLISLFFYLFNQNASSKKLFFLIGISTILLLVTQYIYPIAYKIITHHNQINSGLQRISSNGGEANFIGRRWVEWQKAWMVFKNSKILGIGWNEYAKQSVYLQTIFPKAPLNSGLFTNCHNLILQLLAETGLIGTLTVISGLAYSIYRIFLQNKLENTIVCCMIFTTFMHSMVEYPLWYIYFLGPLVIFLSLDRPIFITNSNIIASIIIIPLSVIVYLNVKSCFIFNTLVYYNEAPNSIKEFTKQAKYLENLVNNDILWEYTALYSLDNYIVVNSINTNKYMDINTQLQYENKFSEFHPYPDNIIKQAMLNWNLGKFAEARSLINLALVAFPVYKNSYLISLKDKKYKNLYQIVERYNYHSQKPLNRE